MRVHLSRARTVAAHSPWLAPLLVALVAVAFHLPTLVESPHYTDEGIFAAVGQRLLQGHSLYRDAWDNKPPLVFHLYAGVLAITGPSMVALRLVGALWSGMAAAGVVVLGRRLLGRRAGLGAGLLAALLLAQPIIEANLTLTELLAAAPAVWAWALLVRGRPRSAFAAGALVALASGFKQTAALDALAAGCWLLLCRRPARQRLVALVGGFTAVTLLIALPLVASGVLPAAWFALVGFYVTYLNEGSGLPPAFVLVRLLPLAVALGGAVLTRRDHSESTASWSLLTLWTAFAALGSTLAGRPFPHYFIQLVAPLTLLVVALGASLADARRAPQRAWLVGVLTVLLLVAAFPAAGGGPVSFAYWREVGGYLLGRRERADFDQWLSWRVANQRRLVELMAGEPERTLFVWGEYPWLYPLAGMENPTRYSVPYHTSFVPGAKDEVLAVLRREPPRFIVWEREEWRRLPGLAELLADRYERVAVVDNTELYRRRE